MSTEMNQFLIMLRGSGVLEETAEPTAKAKKATEDSLPGQVTVEDAQRIFVNVNFEEDATSQLGVANEDKALMRHELMESFIRIAMQKFYPEIDDISAATRKLLEVPEEEEKQALNNMPSRIHQLIDAMCRYTCSPIFRSKQSTNRTVGARIGFTSKKLPTHSPNTLPNCGSFM